MTEDHGVAEIEVTDEMVEAGIRIFERDLDSFLVASLSVPSLVRAVYIAMAAKSGLASTPSPCRAFPALIASKSPHALHGGEARGRCGSRTIPNQ